MAPKYRQFTFIAKAPFDAPYEILADTSFCEWRYCTHTDTCEGYLQYKNPRVTPVWPYVKAVFTPSTLSYMVDPAHKVPQYSFGTPKLPIRTFVASPPSPDPQAAKYKAFCEADSEIRLKQLHSSRVAARQLKEDAKAERKRERWAALNIYNKRKRSI